jgi:hypothetical protein
MNRFAETGCGLELSLEEYMRKPLSPGQSVLSGTLEKDLSLRPRKIHCLAKFCGCASFLVSDRPT